MYVPYNVMMWGGATTDTVVPWCRNLLCHFLLFLHETDFFCIYKGIYRKHIMPFDIIFVLTVRFLHRGTTVSIAFPMGRLG